MLQETRLTLRPREHAAAERCVLRVVCRRQLRFHARTISKSSSTLQAITVLVFDTVGEAERNFMNSHLGSKRSQRIHQHQDVRAEPFES
eukprot:6201298-Pleurochrysis_carterae.AAC.2